MFTKGAKIEITTVAHKYSHMGFTDGIIIPENKEVMIVKSARQTKNGLKVHFIPLEPYGSGYAIDVEKTKMHTFKVIDKL